MVSKLQLCTWDVTSVRQYSPALAEDGAIAPNVSANNAAAGAVLMGYPDKAAARCNAAADCANNEGRSVPAFKKPR